MAKVVDIRQALRAKAKSAPRKRRRRPVPKTPDHALLAGVVFELQSIYGEGEGNFAYRHRVVLPRKGGIAENLYDYGANEYLVGLVSECVGVNKWSKFSFGMLPTAHVVCIRQVVDAKPFETVQGCGK